MGRGYKKGSGQFKTVRSGFGNKKVYESGGTEFVKSGSATMNNQEVVYVSVSELDKAWQKDGEAFYIPPGGGGAEIGGRREGFQKFQETGKPVEMSKVYVTKEGTVSFSDGRHRFSVFRDQGKRVIPVTTDRGRSAERLKKIAGAKNPPNK